MSKALHPQAKFDSIPPDFDLHALVDRAPNFDWVVRISLVQIRRLGPAGFEKLVQLHVIDGGRPLVIEGWDKVLPSDLFSAEWLERTYDKKQENVRDITAQSDIPMTTGHYLRSMRQLTNQWSPTNFRDERRQRLYLKDIDCPPEWFEQLKKIIPPNVFYMNENVSETPNTDKRSDDIFGAPETTPAVAGDLMSSLPEEMRAQNLMCYIGHEGTYTPAHREMCASLGQNIMVEASKDGNGEKAGSSIWFMTETKDREVIREYFLSMLGHDIEIEKHFAQVNAWKKANFPVYVVEQKVGDFILVPPLAPHQVWNRGTRTMKVAWNRTTVETLNLALHEALPRARLVCRDEQYKNKAIIYFTLEKYYKELQAAEESEVGWLGLGQDLMQSSTRIKQMANDFRRLFDLYTGILVDEMFGVKQTDMEFIPFDSCITCSYCRSNIFNRFLTCKCCVRHLVNGDEDTYDICMECYAMGRSCLCVSGLQWCEQWRWADLVEKHEVWRSMVIKQDGFVDIEYSPQPLELARKKSGKKAVAQICQEQLRRRPWNDITKPPEAPPEESEPEVDENGYLKKKKKPARKAKKGDVHRCHVCCHKDYTYRLNFCTTCTEAYCYGVLWRAFDTLPQTVMEIENWQCPKCLGICNCGTCRRIGNTTPYVPRNTLLGHDTRPIADDRSVEFLVDFRMHNLSWLKAAGEENRSKDSRRMLRLREQADAEKAKGPLVEIDTADDARETDPTRQDTTLNGYDNNIPGHDSTNGGPSHAPPPSSAAPIADMTGSQDFQDEEVPSAYPDPTTMSGGRMMGMGFYDQDQSTDKILFDAFKMPSAEALNNEPQVSEYVRKTLRLAKRKARLETDDDPDFRGPKSQPRKKPKTGNIDQLVNLDPALLGSLGDAPSSTPTGSSAPASGAQPAAADNVSQENQDQNQTRQSQPAEPARPPLPIEPLRPTLRNAKPKASYVEAEEPADDPDDTVPVKIPTGDNAETMPKDPIDLAADAIRALTGQTQNPNTSGHSAAVSTPVASGKRRGRPPRSSLGSTAPSSAASERKRRGRPPGSGTGTTRTSRRSLLASVENEDTSMLDAADDSHNDGDASLNQTPVVSSTSAGQENSTGRRRGRPPGRRSILPQNAEPAPSPPNSHPPRRRGRPPSKVPTTTTLQEAPEPKASEAPAPATNIKYMSMAERLALKGKKKFKMTARSSMDAAGPPRSGASETHSPTTAARSRSTTETPASTRVRDVHERAAGANSEPQHGRPELRDEDFAPAEEAADNSESEATPPPPSPPQRKGPTIVRLESSGDSDSVSSSGSHVASFVGHDNDDSGSDEESADSSGPKKRFVAVRGRGRGRGRGGRGGRGSIRRRA